MGIMRNLETAADTKVPVLQMRTVSSVLKNCGKKNTALFVQRSILLILDPSEHVDQRGIVVNSYFIGRPAVE